MRLSSRARMRLWLGGLASAGVALTHFVAFLVANPDHAVRSDVLHETGHHYWPHFAALALGALVAGLVGFVADRVRGTPTRQPSELRRLYGFTVTRLALLQGLGFLYLEAGERLAVRGSFAGLLQEPAVVIGLVVQLLVALVAALLLVLFARVVDTLFARLRPRIRPPKVTVPVSVARVPRSALGFAAGGPSLRGPPLRS